MRLGIIIINDIGIQIARDEDHILNSPGYAVVHEESIFLGEDGAININYESINSRSRRSL